MLVNSLPNYKILAKSKLKEFSVLKLNVTQILISLIDRVENMVRKEK